MRISSRDGLSPSDLICPVFVQEDLLKLGTKVESLPEIERLPLEDVTDEVGTISDLGILQSAIWNS